MGTINYRSSDIITLGYDTDYEMDEEFDEEDRYFQQEDDYYESNKIYEKYDFNWFKAKLEYGYYDGYYLDLDKDYETKYLEDYEIDEIRKEIDDLEKMLIDLVNNSYLIVCYPWWCTKWENRENSLIRIKEAMNKLRKELQNE